MDYRLTFSEYRDALKQGLFKGLKCRQCKGLMIPPRNVCTECGSEDLEIVEFLKEGEMQTFTVIFVAPEGFVAPYIVAMVKLDDGPIVMGNLEGVDPLKVTMELMGRRVKIGHRILPADKHSSVEKVTLTFHLID
jgi:hypothetical protein